MSEASKPESPRAARPRPLPPRSRQSQDGDGEAAGDRRRRLGRRATDMTAEILRTEVKAAMSEALLPLLEQLSGGGPSLAELDEARERLHELEDALHDERERSRALEHELQQTRRNLDEADSQSSDLTLKLLNLRTERDQLKAREAQRLVQLQDLAEAERARAWDAQRMAAMQAEAEQARQDLLTRLGVETRRVSELQDELRQSLNHMQRSQEAHTRAQQESQSELETLRRELMGRSSDSKQAVQLQLELNELRTKQQLSQENLRRQQSEHQAVQNELEQARRELASRGSGDARLQQEINDLRNRLALSDDNLRREKSELTRQLEQARAADSSSQVEQLKASERALREEVKNLQYRLQMNAGGGDSPLETRRLMERLAEMEALTEEKDRLIQKSYGEISEVRGKLDAVQRSFYELQQRYEREKNEWSQLVARQLQGERDRQSVQSAPAPPPPTPDVKKSSWGLFRNKNEG